jgi:Fic family protein
MCSTIQQVFNVQLFRQLRTSITHHSNAIEGTTLTFCETKSLLESGHTAGNKPLHEQLVILGFAKAYDVIVREASNKENTMNSAFIKDIHAIMFEGALSVSPQFIAKPIGAYRINESKIQGTIVHVRAYYRQYAHFLIMILFRKK